MTLGAFGLFSLTGILFIALGIPLVRRRIGPNHLYGLRVPATFADRSVWYDANERSGRDLVILGVGQVVIAVVLLPLGLPAAGYALANSGYMLIGAICCALVGWRRANRMLRSRRTASPGD